MGRMQLATTAVRKFGSRLVAREKIALGLGLRVTGLAPWLVK